MKQPVPYNLYDINIGTILEVSLRDTIQPFTLTASLYMNDWARYGELTSYVEKIVQDFQNCTNVQLESKTFYKSRTDNFQI